MRKKSLPQKDILVPYRCICEVCLHSLLIYGALCPPQEELAQQGLVMFRVSPGLRCPVPSLTCPLSSSDMQSGCFCLVSIHLKEGKL